MFTSLVRERGTRGALARGAVTSMGLMTAQRVLVLGTAIVLARILEPSGYGKYAFAMSLVGIVSIFVLMGLPGLMTREIAAEEARGRWGFVRGFVRRTDQVVLLMLFVAVGGGLVAVSLWPNITGEFRLTFAFALGFMVFDVFNALRGSQLQGLRRVNAGQVGRVVVYPALLLAGVLVLTYATPVRLTAPRALLIALGAALATLLLNIWMVHRFRPAAMRSATPEYRTREWLQSAVPFALMGGLGLVNSQTDIVMLGFLTRSSDVGLYRVASAGAALVPVVLMAVNPVIGPTVARLHALGDHEKLRRTVRTGALLAALGAAPALLIYVLLGHLILRGIFGTAYVGAWLPLVILAGGQFVNAAMGPVGLVLNMSGHERDTTWVIAVSALLNVVLNGALIPYFGMTGAATATAISLVFWNVALAWRVRRRLGFVPAGFPRGNARS